MWGIGKWGETLWGGTPPLPSMSPLGFLILVALLVAIGVFTQRRHIPRWAMWTLGAVVLVIPLAAYAGSLLIPNRFENGTIADADEVNENFDVLAVESNSQDLRLTTVENDLDVHQADASAHHAKTTQFFELAGSVTDSQVPDDITIDEAAHAASADLAAAASVAATAANATNADHATNADDADTLDGLDSTDFAGASHTHSYGKVAIVAQSGGDYTDPKTAMDDLATWCGTPSAANPCLVRIMPGVYDLGNDALTMQPFVDVEGSGENTTTLTSTHSSTAEDETSATVVGANDAEIRFLNVENDGGSSYAIAIYNNAASPKISNVTARVWSTSMSRGVLNKSSSSPSMTDVVVSAYGWLSTSGVKNESSSSPTMTHVVVVVGADDICYGVQNESSSSPIMTDVRVTASTPTLMSCGVYSNSLSQTMTNVTVKSTGLDSAGSRGVYNNSSSPVMTNVTVTTSSGVRSSYGVYNASSSPAMTNVIAAASAGEDAYGVYNDSASPTMTNVTATGSGSNSSVGVYDSSSFPTIKSSRISGTTNSIQNEGGSTAKVGATMLDGPVIGGGFTCVGAYSASFLALSTSCL